MDVWMEWTDGWIEKRGKREKHTQRYSVKNLFPNSTLLIQESNCLRDTDYIAVSTFNRKGHKIHPLMQVIGLHC